MSSLNKVILLGRLGKDPELRYTQKQEPVTTLSLATSETWKGKDGEKQEQTEWHTVVVWGKQAEHCRDYLAKGRQVLIEGSLQTRKWQDKQGADRYSTEIRASNVKFIADGSKREQAPHTQADLPPAGEPLPPQKAADPNDWEEIPF